MTTDKATGGTNREELFSMIELKDKCKDAETRYLKLVFRETYAANLRTTNLIAHLNDMAIEHCFYDDPRYKRLNKTLKNLSKELGTLINGEKGERRAGKALRHLFIRNATLHGVCFEFEGEQAEIDYIVITHKGLFPIEVKYYTFDVAIDDCGYICRPSYRTGRPYNVGEKLRTKEYVLLNALKSELGSLVDPANIHSMILFANDERGHTDSFGRYPTCCCGDVVHKIEEYDGNDVFTDDQITQIKEAILSKTFVPRYPCSINFDEIEADLIYVMELIEASSAKVSNEAADDVDLGLEEICDVDDDDDGMFVAPYDTGYDLDWLWVAGAVPIALLAGYGLYRYPDAIHKLAKIIQF